MHLLPNQLKYVEFIFPFHCNMKDLKGITDYMVHRVTFRLICNVRDWKFSFLATAEDFKKTIDALLQI